MEALAALGRIPAGSMMGCPMVGARPKPPFVQPATARPAWPPVYRPQQPVHLKPRIVQPKVMRGQPRFYPNLNASAAIPVERDEIFKLHGFFEQYRISRPKSHGMLVANAKYIFVRTLDGSISLHPTYRHPVLANGQPVLYAGEMYFDNGKLDWWSNGSGNYRPDADHADQANLPMNRFFTYQDVLKGRHKDRAATSSRTREEL